MSDSVENGANLRVASGSDPASSLRAAALLTLKPKRRKPIVDTDTSGDQGLSQRPPAAETSVQLGYGQEDIGSSRITSNWWGPFQAMKFNGGLRIGKEWQTESESSAVSLALKGLIEI
ncbi:hypothetical protein C8R47DRAFT_1221935 [Mycena vitilis]|nr:hypothetical protein C8R47DRAFT_1221935 [Mycena vitilis]